MEIPDFASSIVASYIAGKLDAVVEILREALHRNPQQEQTARSQPEPASGAPPAKRLFRSFDVIHDLPRILPQVHDPLAHVILEREPSTTKHTAALVLESSTTGEWFVFRGGRMGFQGGGGQDAARVALGVIKESRVPVAVWVMSNDILLDLEQGRRLWGMAKTHAVPLQAMVDAGTWKWIQENVQKLLPVPGSS